MFVFVKTQRKEILNLGFYARIRCREPHGYGEKHQIVATIQPTIRGDRTENEVVIASFETKEEADTALDDLFEAIDHNKRTWNVNQEPN